MRIAIVAPTRLAKLADKAAMLARSMNLDVLVASLDNYDNRDVERDSDVILVIGTDRDALEALQRVWSKPLALVSPPGYAGYIASTQWDELPRLFESLSKGAVKVRELVQLHAIVDGSTQLFAVNEIAVFPQRSATTMEYSLYVDSDLIWRDVSDGIIIATPLGSTAYALSAGGPIVLLNAEVFIVVPVNSVEPRRRPLVVSQNSIIVRDVASRCPIEAIADGITRIRVEENVIVKKGRIVKILALDYKDTVLAKKKLGVFEELHNLPPSAKFVYKMLELEGPMTVRELSLKTLLPERTVRYALSLLIEKGIVEKIADPRDPRRIIYRIREGLLVHRI